MQGRGESSASCCTLLTPPGVNEAKRSRSYLTGLKSQCCWVGPRLSSPLEHLPTASALVLGNKRSPLPWSSEGMGGGAVFLSAFHWSRAHIAKKVFCLFGPSFPEFLGGGDNIYLERFNCLHVIRSRSQGNHAVFTQVPRFLISSCSSFHLSAFFFVRSRVFSCRRKSWLECSYFIWARSRSLIINADSVQWYKHFGKRLNGF